MSERMQHVEPIIKENAVAAARGSRPRISGTARAIRNLSEHNFGVPIADLAKNPQASQRKGKGRNVQKAEVPERKLDQRDDMQK